MPLRTPARRSSSSAARGTLLGGVPMSWMAKWAGGFPLFLREASGARIVDVDGHEYVDFCLGDTGAMAGHAPPATVAAVAEQAARGVTTMLPSEDAIVAAEELTRRFGLRGWQFTLSATDANRFAIRLAREVTGRPQDPRLRLLLPRHRRRDVRDARRRPRRRQAGQRRPAGRSGADHEGGRSGTTPTRSSRRWRPATSPASSPSRR